MIIAVAGRYSAPTKEKMQKNLDRLNEVGAAVFELGHVPVIGLNHALPIIESLKSVDRYEAIMEISLCIVARCDALLLVSESPGANKERDLILSQGKPVYYSIEEIQRHSKTRMT